MAFERRKDDDETKRYTPLTDPEFRAKSLSPTTIEERRKWEVMFSRFHQPHSEITKQIESFSLPPGGEYGDALTTDGKGHYYWSHGNCYWKPASKNIYFATGNIAVGDIPNDTNTIYAKGNVLVQSDSAQPYVKISNASDTERDPVNKLAVGATPTVKWTVGLRDSDFDNLLWCNEDGLSDSSTAGGGWSDHLLITDVGNNRVKNHSAANLTYVGQKAITGGKYVCADNLYYYVTFYGTHKVSKYLISDNSLVWTIGTTAGTGDDQFNSPSGICTDYTWLYICDLVNCRIKKHLCSTGAYVAKVGSYGTSLGQFLSPTAICTDGTWLYITEGAPGSAPLLKKHLCSDLTGVAQISADGHIDTANLQGICTDRTYLYLSNTNNGDINSIFKYTRNLVYVSEYGATGSGNTQFNQPVGITTDETYLYVVDGANSRIKKHNCSDYGYVAQVGTFGSGDSQFSGPVGISINLVGSGPEERTGRLLRLHQDGSHFDVFTKLDAYKEVWFHEDSVARAEYISIKAPATVVSYELTLPGADAVGVLCSDGAGTLTFTSSPSFVNMSLSGYLDMVEIAAPATPAANTLRLYAEDFKGFTFFNFIDSTGMVRKIVRDSVFVGKATVNIAVGQVVYADGSSGNVPTLNLARANAIGTMPAIGIAIEAITAGAFGRVMQVGLLENFNTTGFADGAVLYVSKDTAGAMTTTAPTYPNIRQEMGTVLVGNSVGAGAMQIISRSMLYETIIDHGGLLGLGDDDHTIYIRHALSTAENDFLVGGVGGTANTFVKKTLAETRTILAAEPALGNPGVDGYVLSSTALGVRSWIAAGGALALDDLTDVDAAAPTDHDIIQYHTGIGWVHGSLPAGAAHDILSATHGDTTADTVVRGDIIIGSGATPKWTRLAKGTAGYILAMGADEPAWAANASAPADAKYIVGLANATLSAEKAKAQLYNNYDIDDTPAAPNALDDEFDNSSLDVKWTKVNDPAGANAISETAYPGYVWIGLTEAGATTELYQAAPATGNFAITLIAKVSVSAQGIADEIGEWGCVAIYLGYSAGGASVAAAIQINNAAGNNHGTYAVGITNAGQMSTTQPQSIDAGGTYYIKLEKATTSAYTSANTYNAYFSLNGITWWQVGTQSITFAGACDRVGIQFFHPKAQGGTPTGTAIVDFFRRTV
ncbi:MAG: hypothetical protein WC455_22295 [Dehalococcoidia bacterium]|jgi:hypothetical protein